MPVFHIFSTVTGLYLFDANSNTFLKIDKNIYKSLIEYKKSHYEYIDENVKDLIDKGFLSHKKDFKMIHPMDETLEDNLSRRLNTIALQVTQNCNLRCKYCAYSGSYLNRIHTNKRMSEKTALKAIDFLLENAVDTNAINIGFYGGEPFLEFDLIEKCVEYAKKAAFGKEVRFNVTTNATLLTDKVLNFVNDNSFHLTISLDGNKEVHDKNRIFAINNNGTFNTIMRNIDKVSKKYPDLSERINFNAVIDPQSDFSCISSFFSNYENVKDYFVRASLISNNYNPNNVELTEQYNSVFNYETFKLLLYKFGRLDEKDVSKLVLASFDNVKKDVHERLKVSFNNAKVDHHSGPCVPGAQRLFVDVDGNLFPCERVSETSSIMKIGDIYSGFDFDKVRDVLNIGRLTEKQCKSCWAFRYCTSCAIAADNGDSFSSEHKLENCNKVRSSIEKTFKDYCVLRELGYDFDEEDIYKKGVLA